MPRKKARQNNVKATYEKRSSMWRKAMKRVMLSVIPAVLLLTTSACGQPERPKTVSDFCLLAQRISAEPAPVAGADDPGNQWDTDDTFRQVLEHNNVFDARCLNR